MPAEVPKGSQTPGGSSEKKKKKKKEKRKKKKVAEDGGGEKQERNFLLPHPAQEPWGYRPVFLH